MAEAAKWYVIHTYSGYENKVAQNIEKVVENRKLHELIQEVRVPTERVKEHTADGKEKEYERKTFPGYVLIKMVVTDDTEQTTTARTIAVLSITVFFFGQTTFLNSIFKSLNHLEILLGSFFSDLFLSFLAFLSSFSDISAAVFSLSFLAIKILLPFTLFPCEECACGRIYSVSSFRFCQGRSSYSSWKRNYAACTQCMLM